MSASVRIELAFSHDFGFYGSQEHYCHFLWGYVLPGLYEVLRRTPESSQELAIVLEDCGPVMNRVSADLFGLLTSDLNIVPREDLSSDKLHLPRWDIFAHHESVTGRDEFSDNHFVLKFRNSQRLIETVGRAGFADEFSGRIKRVRDWILTVGLLRLRKRECAMNGMSAARVMASIFGHERRDEFLILKRSDEPHYYSADGGAEAKTYGVTRRSLTDVEAAAESFRRHGRRVRVYEPGAHAIAHQVETFRNCAGVIAIRGADLSNLIWMPEGARMIVVTPEQMNTPPIYKRLGEALGLEYRDISGGKTNSPSLLELSEKISGAWDD